MTPFFQEMGRAKPQVQAKGSEVENVSELKLASENVCYKVSVSSTQRSTNSRHCFNKQVWPPPDRPPSPRAEEDPRLPKSVLKERGKMTNPWQSCTSPGDNVRQRSECSWLKVSIHHLRCQISRWKTRRATKSQCPLHSQQATTVENIKALACFTIKS
jgi:hypothetical protein